MVLSVCSDRIECGTHLRVRVPSKKAEYSMSTELYSNVFEYHEHSHRRSNILGMQDFYFTQI